MIEEELHVERHLRDTVLKTDRFGEAELAGEIIVNRAAAAGAARCCCVLVCGLCSGVWGLEGEHKRPQC